jgi:hypothetical protein
MNISSRYRGIAFLPGDFVYDSDEDRTNGGNATGDEDDPKIGTTYFSYVYKESLNAYLAQMSK